ncbi:MAG TPA: GNAT family N-acetyltransferase [Gemmatimonadales bacterium]|nr:GNAT family N-acetyltransferase [Gemmatimonadales bacterium]
MTAEIIRPAVLEDLSAIHTLAERLADFELPPGRTAREIARADHPILLAQLQQPSEHVLFLYAEDRAGTPLGTIFVNTRLDYFTQQPVAYIEVLAVSEAAAGRGLARRLMQRTEDWARARGCTRVDLNVFCANRRARGFYEHLGFREETVRYVKDIG